MQRTTHAIERNIDHKTDCKNEDNAGCEAAWSIQRWTSAPLQATHERVLPAPPKAVFGYLTDPVQMCDIFAWMRTIALDSHPPQQKIGLGTIRRCHFGNGLVLEETIVGWQPPWRYAYRGIDETHPFGMIGHLGIIECRSIAAGTRLVWQHYFDHCNPTAMLTQLEASVQAALASLELIFDAQNQRKELYHDEDCT